MPITALQLFNASTLEAADLGGIVDAQGELVIDPDASEEAQTLQALAWVGAEVLPGAKAEVAVPVRAVLKNYSTALDNAGLAALFGAFAPEVIALWDTAETSFGRSELNKRVDSNAEAYDKDSDQDRIQGNQRLQKLLEALETWKASQTPAEEPVGNSSDKIGSQSVPIIAVW